MPQRLKASGYFILEAGGYTATRCSSGFGSDMPASKLAVASLALCRSRTWFLLLRHQYEKRPRKGGLFSYSGANIKKNTDFCNDFRKPKQILDDTGKVCFVTFLSKNIRIVIPAPFFMLY